MEAKKAAIEDFFRNGGMCKKPVEKVCLDPDCKYMFLDLDRLVTLGEQVLHYSPNTLIPLETFLENLFEGSYHVDTTEELRNLLEKVKKQRDGFEVKVRVDLGEIETDMSYLCQKIVSRVHDYFAELTENLKRIHVENTLLKRQRLEKFEKTLERKLENKESHGGEEFNLSNFYTKFKMMQKESDKLEKNLQAMIKRKIRYDAFRYDKDLEAFQDLFYNASSFEENVISYIDNRSKLLGTPPGKQAEKASQSSKIVEDAFVQNIVDLIDKTIGSVRHFTIKTAPGGDVVQPIRDPGMSVSKILKHSHDNTFTQGNNTILGNSVDEDLTTPLSKIQQRTNVLTYSRSKSPGRSSSKDASASSPSPKPMISQRQPFSNSITSSSLRTSTGPTQAEPAPKQNDYNQTVVLNSPAKIRAFSERNTNDRIIRSLAIEVIGADWCKDVCEDAASAIDNVTGLEELRIVLADIHHFGKVRLQRLSESISASRRITNLTLCLDRSKLSKTEIQELSEAVESLTELTDFTFSIAR